MGTVKLTQLLAAFNEDYCCEQPYEEEWVWDRYGRFAHYFYPDEGAVACAVFYRQKGEWEGNEEWEGWDCAALYGPLTRAQAAAVELA
jgi:hypothetical protein